MNQAFSPPQLKITLIEALVATLAAAVALGLNLPIWAMFLGWNAYFTRGTGLGSGLVNFACVVVGISLGMAVQISMAALPGTPGVPEQLASVFAVTWLVLSLRFLRHLNNVPALFLGLIAYFASRLEPSWSAFGVLGGAAVLGTVAGSATSAVQARLPARPAANVPSRA